MNCDETYFSVKQWDAIEALFAAPFERTATTSWPRRNVLQELNTHFFPVLISTQKSIYTSPISYFSRTYSYIKADKVWLWWKKRENACFKEYSNVEQNSQLDIEPTAGDPFTKGFGFILLSSLSSSSRSWRIRSVSCFLILKMKLVPPFEDFMSVLMSPG